MLNPNSYYKECLDIILVLERHNGKALTSLQIYDRSEFAEFQKSRYSYAVAFDILLKEYSIIEVEKNVWRLPTNEEKIYFERVKEYAKVV